MVFDPLKLCFKPIDYGLSVSEVILSDQFFRILEHWRSFVRNCLEKRERKFWGTTQTFVNGLRIKIKHLIDTAAGGSSNFSTATDVKKIIEAIAINEHLEL